MHVAQMRIARHLPLRGKIVIRYSEYLHILVRACGDRVVGILCYTKFACVPRCFFLYLLGYLASCGCGCCRCCATSC